MRIDPNARIFIGHCDWYRFKKGEGYIPTDKAPKEAKTAMERYNSYTFKKVS